MADSQVFISYAWGGESEEVANEIESILIQNGIALVRDKTDLGFKGLIREFMQRIGQGNAVVLIISDKYLKSKNCMFELLEVRKNGNFIERILPVVLSDANIYDSLGMLYYIKYWEQKIAELNEAAKGLTSLADARSIHADIDLYTDIRGSFDDMAELLSNMNVLTLAIMRSRQYSPLLDALGKKKEQPSDAPEVKTKASAAKEGKVLYHIPSMMQVESWSRCRVRVAWEELLLLENLDIPEEERVIESIRLGEVMQASLQESPAEGNFLIQAINNQEQIVTEDEFTEWLFDVKPLKAGKFKLILRITLIQIVQGRERAKDVVLERMVTTETFVPRALARFDTASESLGVKDEPEGRSVWFGANPPARTEQYPAPDPTPVPTAGRSRSHFLRYLPRVASCVLLLICGTWVYRSMYPREIPDRSTGLEIPDGATDPDGSGYSTVVPPPPSGDNETLIAAIEHVENTDYTGPVFVLMKANQLDSLRHDSLRVTVISPIDTIGLNLGKIREVNRAQIKDSLAVYRLKDARLRPGLIRRFQN